MLQVEILAPSGRTTLLQAPDESIIGKAAQAEIRLEGWRIAREHARLFTTPSGVLLEDMGAFGGVYVNGSRIDVQFGPLKSTDVIGIGPYKISVCDTGITSGVVQAAHAKSRSDTAALRNRRATEDLEASRQRAYAAQARAAGDTDEAVGDSANQRALVLAPDPRKKLREFEWRKRVHASLLDTMDLRRHDISGMTDERLRAETSALIAQIVQSLGDDLPADIDRQQLQKQVLDEAIGLGPLEELLEDDSVSEIMVNRFDEIYVERAGRLVKHPLTFTGDRAVLGVIERIVTPLGRRIDESSPMVDARLKDGSRVNAIIPPLALKGPCLTIRKFAKRKLDATDLVRFGSISAEMAQFLEVCVVARKNIIVSGGTGSGKTTLLNILSNFIPYHERIITVEDAAELKLHHDHLISLESRPSNVEGKGAVLIRDLVKNTLRMRPDRIVVGECRGAEALDMLQAMNTGHEGSLTTLHANTPRDALARLETMVLMAGMDLPLQAIREQISSAVDIIVQQTRFGCGSRLVTSITEITGMESGKIQMQEIFRFHNLGYTAEQGKIRGVFTGCDMAPTFYEELRATGQALDMAIFKLEQGIGQGLEGDLNLNG
ncbi:MAG TPA: ATPase, T2SS/T4P/T4SS family [Hydrogenophaga sp.]|uniref:ATPase, T2SS/T4P/T4SS family n=1 Tax=Hydrogenophaga sp. TaxID=1904254 RepID=UPI002CA41177|nr:ATPase, T2SS/T4P/T4SS family [Hydrogenophaga sp.]HMN91726.1 ATPase, T2SS/T4P/T4SS family [Hydrogenophaga sp.]HMP10556.1 ATPase, T2SS/T4P/T4SS family [Hydrogenophaga sp.]